MGYAMFLGSLFGLAFGLALLSQKPLLEKCEEGGKYECQIKAVRVSEIIRKPMERQP